MGEVEQARHILTLTRSNGSKDISSEVEAELDGIMSVVAAEKLTEGNLYIHKLIDTQKLLSIF